MSTEALEEPGGGLAGLRGLLLELGGLLATLVGPDAGADGNGASPSHSRPRGQTQDKAEGK